MYIGVQISTNYEEIIKQRHDKELLFKSGGTHDPTFAQVQKLHALLCGGNHVRQHNAPMQRGREKSAVC